MTLTEARRFVGELHRHNLPPQGHLFSVGVEVDDVLVGVAIAGRPVARKLQDGWTVEITRSCTDGTDNANSMLYGALCRAAKALGYRRAFTYTLPEESGSSLRAAGFVVECETTPPRAWVRTGGSEGRYQRDLFGNERRPPGPKLRWRRDLVVNERGAA